MPKRPPKQNRKAEPRRPDEGAGRERLQKVLAAAGIGSRRDCEELISAGRVEVDGEVITQLGTCVDPTTQRIRVDGVNLPTPRLAYFAVNKPEGVVCTNHDPSGRTRVIDLIDSDERLYPVGRLDRTSEGLILVTNDGELANRLTHPRYGVEKVYRAWVAGTPGPEVLNKLRHGIHFSDGFCKVSSVHVRKQQRQSCELEVVLKEGRNREIRRLLARIGHKVLRLKRIAVGPLRLGDLPVGAYRRLSREEVKQLRDATRPDKKRKPDRPVTAQKFTGALTRPARQMARRGKPGKTPTHRKPAESVGQSDYAAAAEGSWKPSGQPAQGAVLGYDERPRRKPRKFQQSPHQRPRKRRR